MQKSNNINNRPEWDSVFREKGLKFEIKHLYVHNVEPFFENG